MTAKKKASTSKKSTKTAKKKVEAVDKTISVLHLRCTNCGEEEEKVLYCSHCDAPLEVRDVKEKDDDEVENDDTLANNKGNDDGGDKEVEDLVEGSSEDVDDLIETGGLTNIFGDGGGSISTTDDENGEEEMDLSDMVSTLDDE